MSGVRVPPPLPTSRIRLAKLVNGAVFKITFRAFDVAAVFLEGGQVTRDCALFGYIYDQPRKGFFADASANSKSGMAKQQ